MLYQHPPNIGTLQETSASSQGIAWVPLWKGMISPASRGRMGRKKEDLAHFQPILVCQNQSLSIHAASLHPSSTLLPACHPWCPALCAEPLRREICKQKGWGLNVSGADPSYSMSQTKVRRLPYFSQGLFLQSQLFDRVWNRSWDHRVPCSELVTFQPGQ